MSKEAFISPSNLKITLWLGQVAQKQQRPRGPRCPKMYLAIRRADEGACSPFYNTSFDTFRLKIDRLFIPQLDFKVPGEIDFWAILFQNQMWS